MPENQNRSPLLNQYILPIKKYFSGRRLLFLWLVICSMLLSSALANAPGKDKRKYFCDQAVHIGIALSIWHDRDLQYTLNDLQRFREIMPSEAGPAGLFLKTGANRTLYYAKPFLYGLFSAPFAGFFGLKGFTVFNAICFFVTGAVFLKIMLPIFGAFYSAVIVISLLVFSPFTSWISIAHPDLFIAAMLSAGGYFLLNSSSSNTFKLLGSFILGMALFEKVTFIFALPFFLVPLLWSLHKRNMFLFAIAIISGWLIPTCINLFQDGNILAYQGVRLYAGAPPFPLEDGWNFPQSGINEHIFRFFPLVNTIFGNLYLLPDKFVDFLSGRQTGILLYFPVAFALLMINILKPNIRSILVIAGLFAYLIVNWLVFPTNGYGGAGTYGSRYLMQALPLIVLAFLWQEKTDMQRNGRIRMWVKCLVLIAAGLSLILQYQVLPPSEKLVRNTDLFFRTQRAQIFPFESSLLPTIEYMVPKAFKDVARDGKTRHMIYKTGFNYKNGYGLKVTEFTKSSDFVLYQVGPPKKPPPLSVLASKNMFISIASDGRVLNKIYVTAGIHELVNPDDTLFDRSFYDLLLRQEIRWKKLNLRYSPAAERDTDSAGWIDIAFDSSLPEFQSFGRRLAPHEFPGAGIRSDFGWSLNEKWGVWTDGEYASLTLNTGEGKGVLIFQFHVNAYTPPESPELTVSVLINGRKKDTWQFVRGAVFPRPQFAVTQDCMMDSSFVHVGFVIENPKSPHELGRGADARKLGLGLSGLRIIKIK